MKKIARKLIVLVLAAVMALGMSVAAFAAGNYSAKLYNSDKEEIDHNPITSVSLKDDGTIVVYLDLIAVNYGDSTYHGYVNSLTINGVTGTIENYSTATVNNKEVSYPSEMKFTKTGITTANLDTFYDISYSITIVETGFTHPASSGFIKFFKSTT